LLKRLPVELKPDMRRVVCMSFNTHNSKTVQRIYKNVISLSPDITQGTYNNFMYEFSSRHRNFLTVLQETFQKISQFLPAGHHLSDVQKALIASYFLKEYSVEAAALFNPSLVVHPKQDDDNNLKVLMSLRACGEGHISSIEFVEGYLNPNGNLDFIERGISCGLANSKTVDVEKSVIEFDAEIPLNEQVLFPLTPDESNGMEDVRFVRFEENSEHCIYYGTFTAYDGSHIKSKLICTTDFREYTIRSMSGAAVNDKGMALFPRKINDKYAMISRQDGNNLRIMYSDDLLRWEKSKILQTPEFPWQFGKLGNCGSPIEVDEGWILLIHGVGPVRKYVMGAYLLAKDDPGTIIARTKNFILSATGIEREGYVPNVVYSCGGISNNGTLYIPFAISDISSGMVTVSVRELIDSMEK